MTLMNTSENYGNAIQNGIMSARNLFRAGFGPSQEDPDYIFNGIFTVSDNDRKKIASVPIPVNSENLKQGIQAGQYWGQKTGLNSKRSHKKS